MRRYRGSVSGDCENDFVEMTAVAERIFGRDCRGSCMHKLCCENEGAPTFREFSILCIEDRVNVDRVV